MSDAKLEVKKLKFVISGRPSIKQCEILNNKRHILTKDKENAVYLSLRISHCFIKGPTGNDKLGFLDFWFGLWHWLGIMIRCRIGCWNKIRELSKIVQIRTKSGQNLEKKYRKIQSQCLMLNWKSKNLSLSFLAGPRLNNAKFSTTKGIFWPKIRKMPYICRWEFRIALLRAHRKWQTRVSWLPVWPLALTWDHDTMRHWLQKK